MTNEIPLKEVSIRELFFSGGSNTYEIPIYQRNYAWGKDEIDALVSDVVDACAKSKESIYKEPVYFIGTLVTFDKGSGVFEVIDGQQRLTTVLLILRALEIEDSEITGRLTYRARRKSEDTLNNLTSLGRRFAGDASLDEGIKAGFDFSKDALDQFTGEKVTREDFESFFLDKVHLMHYCVPKDVDLNRYFEVMNSRGEQLEKHEIEKAKLMEVLHEDSDDAANLLNKIWESCSEMDVYVQRGMGDAAEDVFGTELCKCDWESFDELLEKVCSGKDGNTKRVPDAERKSVLDLIEADTSGLSGDNGDDKKLDSFQAIIDFPNFLLIVLKMTRMLEEDPGEDWEPQSFVLDDKALLDEFDSAKLDTPAKVKSFTLNLLKARFLLDNYVIHHSKDDDKMSENAWKLKKWQRVESGNKIKGEARNLFGEQSDEIVEDAEGDSETALQKRLVHLLSLFEVTFSARQRKNYLFYVLLKLMTLGKPSSIKAQDYVAFMEELADRFFHEIYLDENRLRSDKNVPMPGSFDGAVLSGRAFKTDAIVRQKPDVFTGIYGNGEEKSKGVPLFVFNYLDYKLWDKYSRDLRGKSKDEEARARFFDALGCPAFDLGLFKSFYFSRTRKSLEHFYPRATAVGEGYRLDENQINCFGNYAMIGGEINSRASDRDPVSKLNYYLSPSKKVENVSVASPKFMAMMKSCEEKGRWTFDEIRQHQEKMVAIMFDLESTESPSDAEELGDVS